MEYEVNKRQVRETLELYTSVEIKRRGSEAKQGKKSNVSIARETKFKKFSLCGTSTGFFCQCLCCRRRQSQIVQSMGVGVSIYFKQLKNLMIIFAICTLLSMPAYVLFWSGKVLNNPDVTAEEGLSFNKFIASLSLANIGEKSENVN